MLNLVNFKAKIFWYHFLCSLLRIVGQKKQNKPQIFRQLNSTVNNIFYQLIFRQTKPSLLYSVQPTFFYLNTRQSVLLSFQYFSGWFRCSWPRRRWGRWTRQSSTRRERLWYQPELVICPRSFHCCMLIGISFNHLYW